MRIDDDEIPSDLPDSGRMQRVEISLQFQKRVIIALCTITVILLSSFGTGALMIHRNKQAEPIAETLSSEANEPDQLALRKRLAMVEKDLSESRRELAELAEALQRAEVIEQTGQVEKMNGMLQAQEQAFRTFARNLKDGMYDLSRMVAGSRTWLDEYNQRIDQALAESSAREARLKEIARLQSPGGTPEQDSQQSTE